MQRTIRNGGQYHIDSHNDKKKTKTKNKEIKTKTKKQNGEKRTKNNTKI